jgi:galactokinase
MDQAAVALSRQGYALQLDCTRKSYVHAPLELPDTRVLVAHSGVRRGLSHSQYNQRRAECEQALELVSRASGERFESLTSVPSDLLTRSDLPPLLLRRARHVVSEQARVERAVKKLAEGDVRSFGHLLDQSHFSLRDDYEVSCPELDDLTGWLRSQPGVYGSRLTGAGFGGCTVSLVSTSDAPELLDRLRRDFYGSRSIEPLCFYSDAADGASIVTEI